MNIIFIPDCESGLPIRKFYDEILGSAYRCMFKTERLGAANEWARVLYDSKWNATELLNYHDLALSHYIMCELYKHHSELFSEPPDETHIYIEAITDNLHDNITMTYDMIPICNEIINVISNMHITYRVVFDWFIEEFNSLSVIDINVKHVTSVIWSSNDNALYISAL